MNLSRPVFSISSLMTQSDLKSPPKLTDGMLLAAVATLGPFAANTYVPAFGDIERDFGVSAIAVQQSLSLYLLAFACASLLIGALSDAFGRRRVLIAATIIFALASIGCMFANSIEALYGWRFLMGLCASAGPVISQAIVRDQWQGVEAARILALIAILFGVGPCMAPIVGGELTVLFGWRFVFAFLAFFGALLSLIVIIFLRETLPEDRRTSFRPASTLMNYGKVLRNPAFVAGVLAHGFCFMGLIVYSAGAADFVIHVMKLRVDQFGLLMVPIVGVSMLGAWMGPSLMEKIGTRKLIFGGIALLIISGLAGALVEWIHPLSFPLLLLPPLLYNLAAAAIRPAINVMNLDYFPKNRGLAASVQQVSLTGAFGISSAVLVPLVMGESWKYCLVMLFSGIVMLLFWLIVEKKRDAYLPPEARAGALAAKG